MEKIKKIISRKNFKLYLILLLSIIFIPAAYLFVAAVFVVHMKNSNYEVIRTIKFSKILKAAVLYISAGVAFSRYTLVSSVFGIMMFLCLYALTYAFKKAEYVDLNALRKFMYILSLIVFIIGIIQYFNPYFSIPAKWVDGMEYQLNKRIYSTFFNPNIFGFYINFVLIIASFDTEKKDNLVKSIFIVGIICLFLTFSRTSWISLILAFIFAGIFFDKRYFKYALLTAFVLIGLDKIFNIGRINPIKAAEDSSILYRFEIWKSCLRIIKDNLLTGIGFGTLFKYISVYSDVVKPNIEHCHNIYVQALTETGIVGTGILIYIACNIIKNMRNRISNAAWTIAVMIMLHGLVDSVFLTPQIMMILSIYSGLVLNEHKIQSVSPVSINEIIYIADEDEKKAV